MKVLVLPQAVREIEKESHELKQSVFGALERLNQGEKIQMPFCRSLPSIAKGLYELRFSDTTGELRVFYYIKIKDAIYVVHAMRKKTQKIEGRVVDLLKARIRSLI